MSTIHINLDPSDSAPLYEGCEHEMTIGKRGLIKDYVDHAYTGDLSKARDEICKGLSPKQVLFWEFRLAEQASAWASSVNAPMPMTSAQDQAKNHYLAVLLNREPHTPAQAREIGELDPVEIRTLRVMAMQARTQGDYQRFRDLLQVYVPSLVPKRQRPGAQLDELIGDLPTTTVEQALAGVGAGTPNDEEPF